MKFELARTRLKGRIYIGKPCTEPKMEGERISGKWPDEWRGETVEHRVHRRISRGPVQTRYIRAVSLRKYVNG